MGQFEADLDRWITGNWGEDSVGPPLVCAYDGTPQEDMGELEQGWQCPTCDRILAEDELVTESEYKMQCKDDEPQDFDEWRDAHDR